MNGAFASGGVGWEDGSPARHLALLEHAPVGLFETDAEGSCLFVNRRWCELAGMTPDQAKGTGWVEALHPEDRDRVQSEWYEAASARREFISEYRFQTPSGRVTWLQGSAAAVRDVSGKVVRFVGALTDVSGRKAAEAARDHRTAQLQAIYDAAPVGISVAQDPDCRVITGNRALFEMLGIPGGENVSMSRGHLEGMFHVIHREGEPIPAGSPPMERAARDGIDVRGEILDVHRADGSRVTVLVNASPVRNSAGTVTGAVGICADVTALRESERLLSLIYDNTSDCLYLVRVEPNERYRFLSVNDAFLKTSGVSRSAVVGRLIEDVVSPSNNALIRSKYREAIETRRPVVYFETAELSPGRRHAEITIIPIQNLDGTVTNILGAIKDVTAGKEAEDLIRRNSDWLRLVTDSLPALVAYIDRDLRYRFANASYEEWYGLPPSEILGKTVREVIGEANFAQRGPHIDSVLRGEPVRFEGLTEHRRLGRRRTETFYRPHREDGRVAGFFVHIVDITERKWAEEELRRLNAELRAADRKKDEFLATLAHELRNPLAPIRNAVRILKTGGLAESELAWSRDLIDRQVRQMARLLDDLLDVSRITLGKLELRKRRVALSEVLEAAVETSRPLIEAGRHRLNVSVPPGPIYLDTDPVRLAQVFSNLLNNAAKYTEPWGDIWLTTERAGDEAVVSVRDSGIGVDPEHLPRIFDMFSQETPALERSQGGLGIGLSLVKGLVEMHGGRVEAQSAGTGKGSKFTVHLPVVAPPVPAAATPIGDGREPLPLATRRILVVDDNIDAARTLRRLLELSGHNVAMAHDGLEAVRAAASFRPDVVFLDIGLPRLNGYEAVARIRAEPWGREMHVVALTGWGQDDDRRRALEAGCDDHLTKPVDPTLITNRLVNRPAPHRR